MILTPGLRKVVLTTHITASVGWLGAVVGSGSLAVAGIASDNPETVRGVYLALDVTGSYVLVPLGLASLLTGLVQSLGGKWGLFRHYWVVQKLVINLVAIVVLLLYLQTLADLADEAAQIPRGGDVSDLRDPSPVVHAGAALVLLLVATILSVYKPRGLTRYGQRKQRAGLSADAARR